MFSVQWEPCLLRRSRSNEVNVQIMHLQSQSWKCWKASLHLISVKDTQWLLLSLRCFQPVSEEFQNGEGFGYIVAFRANGTRGWKEKMVTSADSTTYKYRDETFPPLTPFEVKVGVYNNKGDGPFSRVVIIHSAEGGELVFAVACFCREQRGGSF